MVLIEILSKTENNKLFIYIYLMIKCETPSIIIFSVVPQVKSLFFLDQRPQHSPATMHCKEVTSYESVALSIDDTAPERIIPADFLN